MRGSFPTSLSLKHWCLFELLLFATFVFYVTLWWFIAVSYTRDTENTEVAQRNPTKALL